MSCRIECSSFSGFINGFLSVVLLLLSSSITEANADDNSENYVQGDSLAVYNFTLPEEFANQSIYAIQIDNRGIVYFGI